MQTAPIPSRISDDAGVLRIDAPMVQLIDEHGDAAHDLLASDILLDLYQHCVVGRRFDVEATALARQGRLAVYPSSRGQEAAQVGAVCALRDQDWLFPTYRDSVAAVTRGIDPVEVLTLLRGDWHSGYDPYERRVAPQCTPLGTNAPHAVGFAHAARYRGQDSVALVMFGDGASSEGDVHEAMNIAGVWKAPVVFFLQNNGYAISVPLAKQTAASSLAARGVGYGIESCVVDGNDAAAVYTVVRRAVERAAAGDGPTLVEALTYRIEPHTNADDAARYRSDAEVEVWRARDPIARLERYLARADLLGATARAAVAAQAEAYAAELRRRLMEDAIARPDDLFAHVYVEPTVALLGQRDDVREISAPGERADA